MRLIQIVFTEWRDPVAAQQPPDEAALASQRTAQCRQREACVRRELAAVDEQLAIAASETMTARRADLATQLANALDATRAAGAAEEAAGAAAQQAIESHARVGTTGYQVLDDAGAEVVKLVDANGADLPAGAVYGYSVVNTSPALPAWAQSVVVV